MKNRNRKYGSNTARTARGTFARGNPGKPKGARNRASLAIASLLDGEAERLTRKAVQLALRGDTVALRMCLDRIAPPRKERLVNFQMPAVKNAEDAVNGMRAILSAVAEGELTPTEANEASRLLDHFTRTLFAADFETRLATLESENKCRRE